MTKITLLDGSIGQELVKLSASEPTQLWCTAVLLDQPDLVRQVHDSYFAAGATICTTNTYAVLPDRLQRAGLVPDEKLLSTLTNAAVSVARESRDAHGTGGRIAGSIGPLEGSYRPEACPPAAEAAKHYKATVDALVASQVDILLVETMSSVDQAKGALLACKGHDKPIWLSASVMDDNGSRLRSGEALESLKPLVDSYQPQAVLINCSRPEAISDALNVLQSFNKPFGAYANGFTHIAKEYLVSGATVDSLQARQDLSPEAYADYCMKWIDQGATIVGGCCEVGPDHIAELAKRIRAAGHEIV